MDYGEPIGFASWNIELGAPSRTSYAWAKLDLLRSLRESGVEIVALQEVLMPLDGRPGGLSSLAELTATGDFAHILVPVSPRQRTSDRGCVILASDRFTPVGRPSRIARHPSPERAVVAQLVAADGRTLTAASIHFVAGSDEKLKRSGSRWGPVRKRQNFRAVAAWMAKQPARTIAGIDCNSPLVDHPDLHANVYHPGVVEYVPFDQEEYLLHDPDPARHPVRRPYRHALRDAYRIHLERDGKARRAAKRHFEATARAELGAGCLAVSHEKPKKRPGAPPWRRRFDFVFVTPDFAPVAVSYLPMTRAREVGASHAPVIATLIG